MKTTILYWERAHGKTEEIINIIHDNKRTSMSKLLIIHSLSQIARLKKDYNINIPIGVTIMTFAELKHGNTRGMRPDLILIDNADMLDNKIFEDEVKPLFVSAIELILTGSSIKLFQHYRQPEDIDYIKDAKRFVFKVEQALKEFKQGFEQ